MFSFCIYIYIYIYVFVKKMVSNFYQTSAPVFFGGSIKRTLRFKQTNHQNASSPRVPGAERAETLETNPSWARSIHPPKIYQHWTWKIPKMMVFQMYLRLQIWLFWVSMLGFGGVEPWKWCFGFDDFSFSRGVLRFSAVNLLECRKGQLYLVLWGH